MDARPAQPDVPANWWLDDDPLRRAVAARTEPAVLHRAEPLLEQMGPLAPAFFAPRARIADRHRPVLERYDARAGGSTGSSITPRTSS